MSRKTSTGSEKDKIVYFSPPRLSIFESARKLYEQTKGKPRRKVYFKNVEEEFDISASTAALVLSPRKSRSPLKDIQNGIVDNQNIIASQNVPFDSKKRQNFSKNQLGNVSPQSRHSMSGSSPKFFSDAMLDDASLACSSLTSPRRMSLRSYKQKHSREESSESSDTTLVKSTYLNLPSCSRVTLRSKYRKNNKVEHYEMANPTLSSYHEVSNGEGLNSTFTTETQQNEPEETMNSTFTTETQENEPEDTMSSTFTTETQENEPEDTMNSTFTLDSEATDTVSTTHSVGIAAGFGVSNANTASLIESLDSTLQRSCTISFPTTIGTISIYNSSESEFTSQASDGVTSVSGAVDDKTYLITGKQPGNGLLVADSALSENVIMQGSDETPTARIYKERVIVADSNLNMSGVSWLSAQAAPNAGLNEVTSTVSSIKKSQIPVHIKSDKKKPQFPSKIPIFAGSSLKNSPSASGSGMKKMKTKTTQTIQVPKKTTQVPARNLNLKFTGIQPRPDVIRFTAGAASPSTRVQRVNAKPRTMAAVQQATTTTRTEGARTTRREEARTVAFKTAPKNRRTARSYKDIVRTNKTHDLLMAKRNIK